MRERLATILAALGTIIGLRTSESDVTLTVEGRWSGKFDPVRLGLTIMVIVALVLSAFWIAINMGDGEEVMPPTATKTPHPQSGRLVGVEGGTLNLSQMPEPWGPAASVVGTSTVRIGDIVQTALAPSQGLLGTPTASCLGPS